jgi:hypothetical protein
MPIFRLTAHVTVTTWTDVEAETLEDAIEISKGRDVVIGGLHTGSDPMESWIIDDGDGSPENIHVTET